MKILASILSVLGLYLAHWVFKSVLLIKLSETKTIGYVSLVEWVIAGVLSALICFANCMIFDSNAEFTIAIIVVTCIIAFYVPFSIAFAILFNIVMVGCILTAIWKK